MASISWSQTNGRSSQISRYDEKLGCWTHRHTHTNHTQTHKLNTDTHMHRSTRSRWTSCRTTVPSFWSMGSTSRARYPFIEHFSLKEELVDTLRRHSFRHSALFPAGATACRIPEGDQQAVSWTLRVKDAFLLLVMTTSKLSSILILPMMSLPPTQEMTRRLRACAREGGKRARTSKNGNESEGERYRHTYSHTCHWTHADDGVGRGACTYAGAGLPDSCDVCWRQRAHGESIRVHWQDECLH